MYFCNRNGILFVFFCIQVISYQGVSGAGKGKPPQKGRNKELEAKLTKKIKSSTPAQIQRYKVVAAKKLSDDITPALVALQSSDTTPQEVKNDIKKIIDGLKSGRLTKSMTKSIPLILQKAPPQVGRPVEQLGTVLAGIQPSAPSDLKGSLDGVVRFLTGNVSAVTGLVSKSIGGTTELLGGTVKSLAGVLGGVTETVNGLVGSLGPLLGGLLSLAG